MFYYRISYIFFGPFFQFFDPQNTSILTNFCQYLKLSKWKKYFCRAHSSPPMASRKLKLCGNVLLGWKIISIKFQPKKPYSEHANKAIFLPKNVNFWLKMTKFGQKWPFLRWVRLTGVTTIYLSRDLVHMPSFGPGRLFRWALWWNLTLPTTLMYQCL